MINNQSIYCYNVSTIINNETLIEQLKNFLLNNNYNQIYLSINLSLLDDPALPNFILKLHDVNIRTEAVCGTPSWGTPDGLSSMTTMISKIIVYNQNQSFDKHIGSIHLDVEPWIGTGENYFWVDPLLDSYEQARMLLQNTNLNLSIAISGVKIKNTLVEQRQRLINTVDCVVLMQYQNTLIQSVSRTLDFVNDLKIGPNKKIIVAIRSIDFTETTHECMSFINTRLKLISGFSGMATYDYASELIKIK